MKSRTIFDAIGSAHDLAGMLYALKAVFRLEDVNTKREAACDVLICKAHELAAALPELIDETHHAALYAGRASTANGTIQESNGAS